MERPVVDGAAAARGPSRVRLVAGAPGHPRWRPGLGFLLVVALGLALVAGPTPVRTAAGNVGEAGRGPEPDRVDASTSLSSVGGLPPVGRASDTGSSPATGTRASDDRSASPVRPPNTEAPPDEDDDDVPAAVAATPAAVTAEGIPEVALSAYRRAAEADYPGCEVRWQVLAGIGRVESNHGRLGGGSIAQDGTVTPRIVGPRLDGSDGFARLVDTDGGGLDGDDRYERAVGPMQFLPGSWRTHGHDGTGNGEADPDNLFDAARSAVDHLCQRTPGDYRNEDELRRALLGYNPSSAYVAAVTAWIDAYDAGEVAPEPMPRLASDDSSTDDSGSAAPSTIDLDEPEPATPPEPAPEPDADPAPDADPEPAPDADPEPAPDADADPAPDADPDAAPDADSESASQPETATADPEPETDTAVTPEAPSGPDAGDAPSPDDGADKPSPDGEAEEPSPDGEAEEPSPDGEAEKPSPDGEAEKPSPDGAAEALPAPFGDGLVDAAPLTDAVGAVDPGDAVAAQRLRGVWWALADWCVAGEHADDAGCVDAAADTLQTVVGTDPRAFTTKPASSDDPAADFERGVAAARTALGVDADTPATLPYGHLPAPGTCDPTCRDAAWHRARPDVLDVTAETATPAGE